MKKVFAVLFSVLILSAAVAAPVFAGGDKVQKEIGSDEAPGPGSDAQDNQVDGE